MTARSSVKEPDIFYNKTKRIPYLYFWAGTALFYSLIFTTVDFIGNPYSGAAGFLNLLMQWCVVAVSASGVIGLIGINRYVFSVAFPVLMAMSAALGYFKLTMGVALTPMCIELALVNNLNVWGTVMSVCLAMCLAVSVVASVIAVVCRWRYVADRHHAVYAAVAVLIIAGATHVARIKAPVIGRMPYVFYYSVKDYWGNRTVVRNERSTFDNTGVSVPEVSPDVVVVIGESLRSDHVPMNGYHRNTMPRLSRDSNLISFAHVFSEPWCTHTSVPRIMTRADSANPDIAYEEQSFITLFKRAGYHTVWLSNQDSNSTYAYFMHEADSLVMGNPAKSMYNFDKWLDVELVPDIHALLNSHADRKKLMVIHSIGSHWWYRSHYPDSLALFKPETDSRVISELSREQIINSYDNTILATDDFLGKVIDCLRDRNAVLIYISDHGEALGEEGNYLHANDFPELHNPACLVWCSERYARLYPHRVYALERNRAMDWSTDAIFHSVADAAGMESDAVVSNQSFFSYEESRMD